MSPKMGRPKVPKAEKRDIFVVTRVSPEENKIIEKAIAVSGLKQSEWARKALLYAAERNIILASSGAGGN